MISLIKNSLGFTLMASAIYYSMAVENMSVLGGVIHIPSLIMVTGVILGVSIVLMDVNDARRFILFCLTYSSHKQSKQIMLSETYLKGLVDIYHSDGGEELRNEVKRRKMPRIWNIVATKLAINVPIHDIKDILEFQIQKVVVKLNQDIATLKQISALAPAIGMFGSLLGLIRLLGDLKDFDTLGSNMSLALITTLYGIFIGNILFVPLIHSVEKRKTAYIKSHTNLLYWLEHVEQKKPSFYMKTRLRDLDVKKI